MAKLPPSEPPKNDRKNDPVDAQNSKLPLFGDSNHDGKISLAEDDALNINLSINPQQINRVISQASELRAAGVDQLSVKGGNLSLDVPQASALLGPDQHFSAKDDLYFNAATEVTLEVSSTQENTVLNLAPSLSALGVKHLQWDSGQVSDSAANTLVQAGLDFSLTDGVDLVISQAAGTQLSTTLSDLQALRIDNVQLSGEALAQGSLSLDVGNSLSSSPLPLFGDNNHDKKVDRVEDNALNVNLKIDANQLDTIIAHGTQLRSMGVDQLNVNQETITLEFSQARQMLGVDQKFSKHDDLYFSQPNDVTLKVNPHDVNAMVRSANDLHQLGIDHIQLTSGTVSDTTLQALIAAGLDFSLDPDVTLEISQATGTQLATSLDDLQKIGIDNVLLSGEAATIGSLSLDLGDSFADSTAALPLTNAASIASSGQPTFSPATIDNDLAAYLQEATEYPATPGTITHFAERINSAQSFSTLGESLPLTVPPSIQTASTTVATLGQAQLLSEQLNVNEIREIKLQTEPQLVAEIQDVLATLPESSEQDLLSTQDLQLLANTTLNTEENLPANLPQDLSELEIIKDHDIPQVNTDPLALVEVKLIGQQPSAEEWIDT